MNRKLIATVAAVASLGATTAGLGLADAAPVKMPAKTTAAALTKANLPTAAQLKVDVDQKAGFVAGATVHGEAKGTVAPCQAATWSSLGAKDSWTRSYTLRGDRASTGAAAIARFATAADARNAARAMTEGLKDCEASINEMNPEFATTGQAWRQVKLDDATPAFVQVLEGTQTDRGISYEIHGGVVVKGNRAELVSMTFVHNQEPYGTNAMWATLSSTVRTLG